MNKFLRYPHGPLVLGTVVSSLVGIAVFVFAAPPIILIPANLIAGTAYVELRRRVIHPDRR